MHIFNYCKIVSFVFIMIFFGIVRVKAFDVEEIGEGRYQAPFRQNLFLVMERVTEANHQRFLDFKKNITETQRAHESLIEQPNEANHYHEPLRASFGVLSEFRERVNYWKRAEVFVAYVSTQDQKTTKSQEDWHKHVIMSFAVSTSSDAPFTQHYGIARNPLFTSKLVYLLGLEKESPDHKNLAIPLHAFAAKATLMRTPDKTYMITYPLNQMFDILAKGLPKESYQSDFSNKDGNWVRSLPESRMSLRSPKNTTEVIKEFETSEFPWFNIQGGGYSKDLAVDLHQLATLK